MSDIKVTLVGKSSRLGLDVYLMRTLEALPRKSTEWATSIAGNREQMGRDLDSVVQQAHSSIFRLAEPLVQLSVLQGHSHF